MRENERWSIALLKGKIVNCTGDALSGYIWGCTYQGQSHTDAWVQTPYPVFICAHLVTLSICLSSAYLLPHSFDSSEWDIQILLIWSSCDFSSFGHGLPGSCLVQCLWVSSTLFSKVGISREQTDKCSGLLCQTCFSGEQKWGPAYGKPCSIVPPLSPVMKPGAIAMSVHLLQ